MSNIDNAHLCALLLQKAQLFYSKTKAAQLLGWSVPQFEKTLLSPSTSSLMPKEIAQALHFPLPSLPSPKDFSFIDLFAGIGGLRQGFESAGGQCVFTSEWNRFSGQTYSTNFLDTHPITGDITKVLAKDIPAHDVLLAGFPCQAFSLAGKKGGFSDTRGTLFFDVARILQHHRPKAFLLENVKNLLSHDKGNTWKTIYHVLTEQLGYHVHFRVIDAKYFVPQHRERIYIVGFANPTNFSFPSLPAKAPTLASILHTPSDAPHPHSAPYFEGGKVHPRYTLSDKLWAYLQSHAAKHQKAGNGFGFGLFEPHQCARTLSARYYKDGSEVLIAQENQNPRRLTPRECARLMGFADSFVIPVSDSQSYKQFGNSVVVPVSTAIAAQMKQHL